MGLGAAPLLTGAPAARRVARVVRGDRVFWRKRYADQGRGTRIALLRWLARCLRAPALQAPLPLDAAAACATEARMITMLRALGARVPDIVESSGRELLLSDLGPTLAMACRAAVGEDARARRVADGFRALARVHAAGGYLSQAFARNMTWSDGAVGFIDLEQDPLTAMPLDAAQARDVLLYVYSTARYLPAPRYRSLLARHLAHESRPVRDAIAAGVRRLAWLPVALAPFGRHGRVLALPLGHLVACTTRPYAPVQTA